MTTIATTQLPLFDVPAHCLSRRTDPPSSAIAARQMESSGAAASQRAQVLEALRRYPDSTTAELAALAGINRFVVARRMKELETRGLAIRGEVRVSKVGGPAQSWRAK